MSDTLSQPKCEWKEQELSELAELRKDSWKVGDEQLPYIALEHIVENGLRLEGIGDSSIVASNKYFFDSDNFLFGKLRPYFRKLYRPNFQGICSTDIWVVKPKEDNDKDFLFYFFANKEFIDYSYSGSSGTRMPRADWNFVSKTKWRFPKPDEQNSIAEVLSSLDDKIDLLHRQNQTLEQMAEALFRQWFVEAIQKIEFEGKSVEGFHLEKFTKWIEGTVGGEWGKETPQGDYTKQVYCIRGTDIADLNTGLPLKIPTRFVKDNKFEKIKPAEGDLIIEISGGTETQSTGRVTYINSDIENLFDLALVFSNFCRMIKVKKSEYSFFIYCYIQYLYNQDEFFNLENGSSGIKNLDYKALLLELDYPMPNEELVLRFHENVHPLFKKINKNKTHIRTLTALRDTLLPKLMNGEIRIDTDE